MDLWQRAKGFVDEAAKRSQEISKEAARRSQELTQGAARFSQEFVSETAKKSKEIAAEAAKKADLLRSEALIAAEKIKTIAADMPVPSIPSAPVQEPDVAVASVAESELLKFGITEELREFVRGITLSTFRDFPIHDEPDVLDSPTVSNVRQDLNEWQAKHATLVLSTVKEIAKFRYELCPRCMKERKFWRIYFLLVNNHTALYEKQYMEESKETERKKIDSIKEIPTAVSDTATVTEARETKLPEARETKPPEVRETKLPEVRETNLPEVKETKPKASTSTPEDLDAFLLGDLGSDDDGLDDGNDDLDVDFDKLGSASGSDSDSEKI